VDGDGEAGWVVVVTRGMDGEIELGEEVPEEMP